MEDEKKFNAFRIPMIELMTIIGIFSVVSVLIVQMFLSTDKMQARAINISRGVLEAESLAESIKGSDDSNILQILGAKVWEGKENSYTLFYDKEWNPVDVENSNLIIIEYESVLDDIGTLDTYRIIAYAEGKPENIDESDNALCNLIVKKYIGSIEN